MDFEASLAEAVMYQEASPSPRTSFSSTAAAEGDGFLGNHSSLSNQSWISDPGGNLTKIDSFFFYESIQFPVMWFLFVTIVAGNSCVIAALLLAKPRKSRMNYFIMHLAIADLCVGLISVFVDIVQKFTIAWLAGNLACKFIKFLQAVVTYSSTYVLVALSIDRCDAITRPMNFSGSWKRAKGLVASAWLLSIVLSIPILILYEEKVVQDKVQCWIDLGSDRNWKIWMTSITVALFVIPALTITACYTVIVVTIWAKNKVVISPPSSSKNVKRNRQADDVDSRRASSRGLIPRAKIKTIKMTFVIVFVFIICWSPYIVFDMLQVYKLIPPTQQYFAVATLVQSLAPLNSAANPLIYCIFSTHIFNSLRKIPPFKWLCWRSGGSGRGRHLNKDSATTTSEMITSSHRQRRNTVLQLNARDRADSTTRMHLINNGGHPASIVRQSSDTSTTQGGGKKVHIKTPLTSEDYQ